MTGAIKSIAILLSASFALGVVSDPGLAAIAGSSGQPDSAIGAGAAPALGAGVPAGQVLIAGDAGEASARGSAQLAQSENSSLPVGEVIEHALAMVEAGEREGAKALLSDVVSKKPIQAKIGSYRRQLEHIAAQPGSVDLTDQLEAEGVPALALEEAQALYLLAVLSLRDEPAVRCGNGGTDALLLLAALDGHAPSQFKMGVLLAGGTECGWTYDLETAASWYEKAAAQGHQEAKVNHAIAQLLGSGIPKDEAAAVAQLTASAGDDNNARAQYLLGAMYLAGHGVRKITTKAITFLRASAEQGFIPAQTSLGKILWERAILEEEREEARMWLLEAAEQGDPEAQYFLGKSYSAGSGGESWRFDQAVRWLEHAARAGHPNAQAALGLLLWQGDIYKDTVPPQPSEAVPWLRLAAEQGQSMAQTYLGYAYANGQGVDLDLTRALAWWRKAAEQNNSRAEEALGYAYQEGRGVPKDGQVARAWFERAAQHGSMGAKEMLADRGSEMQRLSQHETAIQLAAVLVGIVVLFGGSGGGGGDAGSSGYTCNQAFCGTPEHNAMMLQYATGGM